jgi:hypothetical protein
MFWRTREDPIRSLHAGRWPPPTARRGWRHPRVAKGLRAAEGAAGAAAEGALAELRAALGEHGRHGRFIRTVHGFGYAFSCDATDVSDPPSAFPPPAYPPSAGPAASPAYPPPAQAACWLSWGERDYVLRPGEQTIGRDRTADVRIDALSISRLHGRLTCRGAEASIEGLGSKNGTWVSGAKVAGSVPLEDGDRPGQRDHRGDVLIGVTVWPLRDVGRLATRLKAQPLPSQISANRRRGCG